MAEENGSGPPESSGTSSGLNASVALDLFSIAGSLNSTLDLDFLLQKIGLAAERLLDSEASSIMLVTDDKRNLYFRVASGSGSTALKKMTLPIGKGIAGWVAQNRKPEVVNDTRSDPRFAGQFDKASGFVTRSLLAVPMLFRGELVGVAEVLNKRDGTYSVDDIGLLSSLANLASVAITNTKIIQDQKNFFSHVIELLTATIETSRPKMEGHPPRAARLACAIGRLLEVEEYEYRMLYYAGILHDIGYIAYRNPRLMGDLGIMNPTEEHHTMLSAKLLEGITMIEGAVPMIQHHHENWDGSGFPGKLKGEAICLGGRILCVVESIEELRMMGLRGPELIARARDDVKAGSGTRFDPQVAEAAVALLETDPGVWG